MIIQSYRVILTAETVFNYFGNLPGKRGVLVYGSECGDADTNVIYRDGF